MARELRPLDVSDTPDVLRLAQEVARSGVPKVLRTEGEDLAVIIPVPSASRPARRGRPVTSDDSLFNLIGIGESEIEGGASERKHDILARAYRPRE